MFCKKFLSIIILLLLANCTVVNLDNNKPKLIFENSYINKGFAIVYSDNLLNQKIISKRLDERSLTIFQRNLKKGTQVKITNILNNKSLIATVGKKAEYPSFNNVVLSIRIANELDLDISEPYIRVMAISENSLFVARKAKTYEEEKKVANKAPVKNISINDLNEVKVYKKKITNNKFTYNIKIADFYFKKTALMMVKRIKDETKIENPKIKKISDKEYRVYLGPFNNINSLQKSFNDINLLVFENIEIIKND